MDRFVPGSAAHIAPIVATLALAALAIVLARGAPDAVRRRWEIAAGVASIGLVVLLKVRLALAGRPPEIWLPLNVCDWSNIAAGMALIAPARFWSLLTYYFGLGLSSVAALTPDIAAGPAMPEYWLFWARHGAILAIALYELGSRGYRPAWRDYGVWCAVGFAYVAVAVAVNQTFGTNYGYVGDVLPENTSAPLVFGPWPQRAFVMLGLAIVQGALLTAVGRFLPAAGRPPAPGAR